jgi:DNA repair protein RecO (recombination protein O)
MKITTRGIVLHHGPYSETSLVVKIYTEQFGLGSFIVSGVRTRNSRFKSALFQPLTLVELVCVRKPGSTLHRITQVHPDPVLSGIPGDLIKSTMAIFMAEVLYRSIREEEPNAPLFHFLHNSIQVLDISHGPISRFHLCFMIQLTRYLGFFPGGTYSSSACYFDLAEGCYRSAPPSHMRYLGRELSASLSLLCNSGFDDLGHLELPPGATRELLKALVLYFELHQTHGNSIRSHKVLEEVLV